MNKTWPHSQGAYIQVVGKRGRKGKMMGGYSKKMWGTRKRKKLRKFQGVLALSSALICHLLSSRGKV